MILYLRRPADIANSLYSTSVKAGRFSDAPPSPKQGYWNNICNHKVTLEKFSSVFGDRAIIPRLFDKAEFENGSIIDDVIKIVGIPSGHLYQIPKNQNEGLSFRGLKLLKAVNKVLPKFIANRPNPVRALVVNYLVKLFPDDKYKMSDQLYKEYDRQFFQSNEWVRKKYFPHKDRLFSDETIN